MDDMLQMMKEAGYSNPTDEELRALGNITDAEMRRLCRVTAEDLKQAWQDQESLLEELSNDI